MYIYTHISVEKIERGRLQEIAADAETAASANAKVAVVKSLG